MTTTLSTTTATDPGGVDDAPSWLIVGSAGLWGAECLTPGCLWTTTTPTPETADAAAGRHVITCRQEGAHL